MLVTLRELCVIELNKRKQKSLTLVGVRRGEDGAVLPLHLLNFLCQRLDETPDLLHLSRERQRQKKAL